MENIINAIYNVVWSNWLVYLCLLSGVYFSLRTKFSQIRNLKTMIKLLLSGEKSDEGISSFQGFCTALAGRIGTGNIAGVATAIAWGGPGALFWMWAIAFLGAGSAFAESTLGQLYKEQHEGQYRGGPAYYIEKGLGETGFAKAYGLLFAIVTVIAIGILLPGVQSNSIADAVQSTFGLSKTITAGILVVITGIVVLGGIKRIGSAAEFIVPFMGGIYILMAVIIIIVNIRQLPMVLGQIFKGAFGMDATFGGIIGSTIAWGVKRGVYSNEAGQGTGPQSSSAAEVNHPAVQGFVQSFSVYVDTLFVCSATGFMILMTNCYTTFNEKTGEVIYNAGQAFTPDQIGPQYTIAGINTLIHGFGGAFVTIALFFFVFTTLMAYYYIAEVNLTYIIKKITGGKSSKAAIYVLIVVFLVMVAFGAVKSATLAWTMGDIGVGMMAWLNIIAILILSNTVMKCFNDYERQLKAGVPTTEITFDPVSLGIKGATFWEERAKESKKA
ncbi:MAG: alanine:cation symporter family protein [Intestinibacter sp.]|uniref:alanine/glycine:cation symporter family protein n=1 Tax=Intestinibacter sp. TaxID=1965304 RepID=UPI0025C37868|nr:alanine/glycine:cation symporter family protein [Intestinibacter sp.]MCI6737991.1 alanine:cation symporter family protein [Intestinibacter sp.]